MRVLKTGTLEDARGGVGIAKRERVGARLGRARGVAQGGVDRLLVADVVEPLGRRHLTCPLEHPRTRRRRQHGPAQQARRLTSRQPGPAADVDDVVTPAHPMSGAKVLG